MLRKEIKCMRAKITCEGWKVWGEGRIKMHKKLRRNIDNGKKVQIVQRENIKCMRGEINCERGEIKDYDG